MGRHSAAPPPRRSVGGIVVVALVLVLGVGGGLYYLLRQTDSVRLESPVASSATTTGPGRAANCASSPGPAAVAVAPPIADVVTAAAARVSAANPCLALTVTPTESAAAAAAFSGSGGAGGSGSKPVGWVSDSSVFVDDVRAATPGALAEDVQAIATSPLVLAVPTPIAAKAGAALANPSWVALVAGNGSIPVRLTDPDKTTSGRLLLVNAPTAVGDAPATRLALGSTLLAWSHSSLPKESDLFAAATTPQAGVFATSEQQVASYLREHGGAVTAVVPSEGTGKYDYSLVAASGISADASNALTALRTQLTSDTGKADLTKAGFRVDGSESTPGVPGMPSGSVKYLADPSAAQRATMAKTWTGVKTDSRMLAMIDVSGSMKEKEGGRTRIDLANEAAQTAISIFPTSAQVGLWSFGVNKGGRGQDWREVVPIRQLDEPVGGSPQRDVLGSALPGLVPTVGGGTGLYDSLLAAYQQMVSSYTPGRVNSVVLLTDGRNDKPTGLTLEQLLAKLNAAKDPAKPVVIVTVGMGQDVDTAALSAVSAVTGGKSYQALDPQDIKLVFIDALLSRDCSGGACTSR